MFPIIAELDCVECQAYLTDENWRIVTIAGRKQKRPKHRNAQSPCRVPEISGGCPKGTPENPKTLSQQNLQAYWFHRQCKAVGRFPDDAVVMQNAAIIEDALRQCDSRKRREENEQLKSLIIAIGGKKHVQ